MSNWFLRKIEDHDADNAVRAVAAKTGYVMQSGNCAASYGEDARGHGYLCVTANAYSSWRAHLRSCGAVQDVLPLTRCCGNGKKKIQ